MQFIGDEAFADTNLMSITLRSYVEVGYEAFAPTVTVYTDAASVPESWNFVNGHYIFFDCGLSAAGNYVKTICVQRRNGFTGIIYDPYRQLYYGCSWGSNQVLPYFIKNYEFISYSFDEIINGALPVGERIYAILGFATPV